MKLESRTARARMRVVGSRRAAEREQPAPLVRSGKPARRVRSLLPVPPERPFAPPDLLHATPMLSLDEHALAAALSFAFVAGSAGGAVASSLANAAVAPSGFGSGTLDTLSDELFLDELCSLAFAFSVQGKPAPIDRAHLKKLIAHPPSDSAHVSFRQAILAELSEKPELARALADAYQAISILPHLLDDEGVDARLDMTQWRLDVLTAIRNSIASLATAFAGAHSGLARLHELATHVQASSGYRTLASLLDFESDAARAQLQIRLGADGRIRQLDIMSLAPRTDSAFHVGGFQRFWRRLVAFLQGYRIGPAEVVERWLESVFDGVKEHIPTLLQLKQDLEFYLCALHFAALAKSKGLAVSLPILLDRPDSTSADNAAFNSLQPAKELRGLFNPLLLGESHAPVPTDLQLPTFACTCITTGPNSGGKTRFLQALALTQLLGQCGMFVPAAHAVLRRAAGMFVSLGEPTHADQKEGRLGMELMRIRNVFEQAQRGSIVILDELCSGTNPSEGEEIFRMLLELLHELGHEVHVTTHFLSFAQSLTRESQALGLHFLQVELDAAQHATYRFVPGVATTSLAQQTAERLGVTRDQLRALIKN